MENISQPSVRDLYFFVPCQRYGICILCGAAFAQGGKQLLTVDLSYLGSHFTQVFA